MYLSEGIFSYNGSFDGDDTLPTCFSPSRKKIIFFTSEALVAQRHLNDILPFLRKNNISPIVILTPPVKSARASIPSLQKFYYLEEGILGDVIYPELDKQSFHNPRLIPTFNKMVSLYDVDYIDVDSMKNPIINSIIDLPNVIGAISIYQDCIFKQDLIDKVKSKGFFWNLHPAVLPENRGIYLAFWNLLEGRHIHGNSLHEIDAGIDTGRIISSCQGILDPKKPILESYIDFTPCGSQLVTQALSEYLAKGYVTYAPVIEGEIRYRSFPTEDDIVYGQKNGVRLIGDAHETLSLYQKNFGNNKTMLAKAFDAISLVTSESFDFSTQNLILENGYSKQIVTNIEEIPTPAAFR